MSDTKQQAKWIRSFRWLHRKIAIALFIFFFLVSVTGLLLGIKKQTGLLAATQRGVSQDLSSWLPLDSLHTISKNFLRDSVSGSLSSEIDRLDVRPDKGIVKILFKEHYNGLQIDGVTGRVLLVEKRRSDFIEDLHDGSILDNLFGTSDEQIKVGYTVTMGLSLLLLTITGVWLWYGPKRLRRMKRDGLK